MQPEGWSDILPYFEFYTTSDFCFPLKYTLNGEITGTGCAIVHGKTAWLAHIIVHKEYRNRGIGLAITQALVDRLRNTCETILLIATALGEPVYKKVGFKKETEYVYLKEGKTASPSADIITSYRTQYSDELLALDRMVSGEDRKKLLMPHLNDAHIVIHNNTLEGYYIPTLGEGLIISRTARAGLELLKLKHASVEKAALPVNNNIALEFLINNNFREVGRGARMVLGKEILWQPDRIYSRIGGYLG